MGDTVRQRRNHYEMLGLTPAASPDEIGRAFTKQLGLIPVRPFGSLAQISVAYETLRDPAKREAYDAALFPRPPLAPSSPVPAGHPVFAQLFRPKAPEPVEPVAAIPLPAVPPSTPPNDWKPAPPAPVTFKEQRPAPSEAQSEPTAKPEELVRRMIAEERAPSLYAASNPPLRRDAPARVAAPDREASLDWRLPALAAGAVILAIVGGTWAGLEAGNDNEVASPDRIATLRVPPARPAPAIEASPPTAPIATEVRPLQRAPARVGPVEHSRPPLEIDLAEVQPAEGAPPAQAQPVSVMTEAVAAEAPGRAEPAAELPLPNAVIARTIHRIGYGCGQVVSTAPIDGAAAGVFKVTCTSGQSYRAAPVRGRYRFSRMGGR